MGYGTNRPRRQNKRARPIAFCLWLAYGRKASAFAITTAPCDKEFSPDAILSPDFRQNAKQTVSKLSGKCHSGPKHPHDNAIRNNIPQSRLIGHIFPPSDPFRIFCSRAAA
jgi:hypothetical protein